MTVLYLWLAVFTPFTGGLKGLAHEQYSIPQPTEAVLSAVLGPGKGGVAAMITSREALNAAVAAVKVTGAGDIVVQRKEGHYSVNFAFVTASERRADHVLYVTLDSTSGKVIENVDLGPVINTEGFSAGEDWQQYLSPKAAYDVAYSELERFGFREYDPLGRLSIQLRDDAYFVTFPAKPGGSRGPDYAIQLVLDARTGKIRKSLVGS